MFRLNVGVGQLEECVRRGMFALSGKPQIEPGEVLLLQLKKGDWQSRGATGGRIEHALVFQRAEYDEKGTISKTHWPTAGKSWPWIIYSSAVLDVKPFSLEDLPLNRESRYQAQANPVHIDPEDEQVILPYIDWSSATPLSEADQLHDLDSPIAIDDTSVVEKFSVERAVALVQGWFPGAQIQPMKHSNPGFDITVTERGRIVRYIEVKGTRAATPIFHLTETERRFSVENAALYTLLVIWMIDLKTGTHRFARHEGEVALGAILRPERYAGRLPLDAGDAGRFG